MCGKHTGIERRELKTLLNENESIYLRRQNRVTNSPMGAQGLQQEMQKK